MRTFITKHETETQVNSKEVLGAGGGQSWYSLRNKFRVFNELTVRLMQGDLLILIKGGIPISQLLIISSTIAASRNRL